MAVVIPAETKKRSFSPRFMKFNLGRSRDFDSVQHVQVHQPEQRTYQRRKSSSGGSYVSRRSSQRSKRGERSDFRAYTVLLYVISLIEHNQRSELILENHQFISI